MLLVDGQGGYAWTNADDVFDQWADIGWRPATRSERIRFELRRPRVSIQGFLIGCVLYAALRLALEWLA